MIIEICLRGRTVLCTYHNRFGLNSKREVSWIERRFPVGRTGYDQLFVYDCYRLVCGHRYDVAERTAESPREAALSCGYNTEILLI